MGRAARGDRCWLPLSGCATVGPASRGRPPELRAKACSAASSMGASTWRSASSVRTPLSCTSGSGPTSPPGPPAPSRSPVAPHNLTSLRLRSSAPARAAPSRRPRQCPHATLAEALGGAWPAIVRSDTGLYGGDYDKCATEAELAIETGRVEVTMSSPPLALNLALAHAYRGDLERALATAATARNVARTTQAPSALAWVDFLDGGASPQQLSACARPLLERALHRGRAIRSALTEGNRPGLVDHAASPARRADPGGPPFVDADPPLAAARRLDAPKSDPAQSRVAVGTGRGGRRSRPPTRRPRA